LAIVGSVWITKWQLSKHDKDKLDEIKDQQRKIAVTLALRFNKASQEARSKSNLFISINSQIQTDGSTTVPNKNRKDILQAMLIRSGNSLVSQENQALVFDENVARIAGMAIASIESYNENISDAIHLMPENISYSDLRFLLEQASSRLNHIIENCNKAEKLLEDIHGLSRPAR